MHLPEIDRYAGLDSPLHRWDPRVKLPCMTALLVVAALSPTYAAAGAALALALGLVALSRIPVRFVFTHLRWVLMFCLLLLVALALTAGGEPLAQLGPVRLSRPGLRRGGLVALRAVAAVLFARGGDAAGIRGERGGSAPPRR